MREEELIAFNVERIGGSEGSNPPVTPLDANRQFYLPTFGQPVSRKKQFSGHRER